MERLPFNLSSSNVESFHVLFFETTCSFFDITFEGKDCVTFGFKAGVALMELDSLKIELVDNNA